MAPYTVSPSASPGEPRPGTKPQPIGNNMPMIFLFTTCTLCILFILFRRASAIRTVVSHQLKTWTRQEGGIRLSIDDGPPAQEFLEDDYDDDERDELGQTDDEPLPHAPNAQRLSRLNVQDPPKTTGA